MIEPELETDIERMHRSLYREPADPREGREPPPWWLWAAVAVTLFWGGWYLGRYGGSFDAAAHLAFAGAQRELPADAPARVLDPIARGESLYDRHCQSCHQASGEGVPGAFPPVVGSEWVVGSADVLIRILLQGLQGPIEVAGERYSGSMPGWEDILTDAEVAATATFIRQWRTNDAPPVEPAAVADVRAATADRLEPWTAPELPDPLGAAEAAQ